MRLIPISKFSAYLTVIADIGAMVELACDKPAGWSDQLTDESIYQIDALSRKLNDPRVDRYLDRMQVAVNGLKPHGEKLKALTSSSLPR